MDLMEIERMRSRVIAIVQKKNNATAAAESAATVTGSEEAKRGDGDEKIAEAMEPIEAQPMNNGAL